MKIYDEPELPDCGACLGYVMKQKRRGAFKIYDERESLQGGGVFKIYDEAGSAYRGWSG